MIAPSFYAIDGQDLFMPKPAHPGEDAGADIRAFIEKDQSDWDKLLAFIDDFPCLFDRPKLFIDAAEANYRATSDLIEIANKESKTFVMIAPGKTVLINAGFKMSMPSLKELGFPWSNLLPVYQIVSRSGLACKHNIVVTNAPGIIDAGYRDWVRVSLTNNSNSYHIFTHGARIAQGLYSFVLDQSTAIKVDNEVSLGESSRLVGGFGSTNV